MRTSITGTPGAGKSTVLRHLESLGHTVVQADEIARDILVRPDILRETARLLSLPEDAPREARREAMWADPTARARVNALVHPLVADAMRAHPAEFHEIPLLVENARYGEYDEVWCVLCGDAERLERLTARYGNRALALAVSDAQLPGAVKAIFAHHVLRTDRDAEPVRGVIERLLAERRKA